MNRVWSWNEFYLLKIGLFFECGYELLGSINQEEFIEELRH